MPLIELWKNNREQIEQYAIDQIVAFAGGKEPLKDGNSCAAELREYLSKIPTQTLGIHVEKCLTDSFKDSGLVLQDIVNELGRRLDYKVENGLYQGRKGAIGFDGLWKLSNGHSLVVEVKTTDAYRINLDTLANYRMGLLNRDQISTNSSILIVVGRQDTGDIEAQVRGSRHAWDIRLISADALLRLVDLKEKTDEDETLSKIQSLLVPFEYTRLDNIIDVVFATAKDVEAAVDNELQDVEDVTSTNCSTAKVSYVHQHTPQAIMTDIRNKIVKSISEREGVNFLAHKRSLFWSPDHKTRAIISLSKLYDGGNGYYWYGFHPQWKAFLESGDVGFHVLGCVGKNYALALPRELIIGVLDRLNTSEKDGALRHWHIHIEHDDNGEPSIVVHKTGERLPVSEFKLPL
ncbi:hypothetical protein [Magnetovibrio blakemorei]|uniref:Uncharacterized protein n=1 Tax=Magnetovibrio blakemorei TaxID=28181 RepID=A0A1E5Q5X6_9PROT|nr:hypothetical protein [Magnetovibrio blakemorei]OEJ65970.1 hypothetical protein BEN30_13310 [Magnetovibrio blakemorei]